MWHENLDNNIYLRKIYSEIPMLIGVRIDKIEILDEGNRISLIFDMPYYADTPPEKWKVNSYNSTVVQIDFFGIRELAIRSDNNIYSGTIEIYKNDSNLLNILIEGTVEMKLVAEVGTIQSVGGYCNDISKLFNSSNII